MPSSRSGTIFIPKRGTTDRNSSIANLLHCRYTDDSTDIHRYIPHFIILWSNRSRFGTGFSPTAKSAHLPRICEMTTIHTIVWLRVADELLSLLGVTPTQSSTLRDLGEKDAESPQRAAVFLSNQILWAETVCSLRNEERRVETFSDDMRSGFSPISRNTYPSYGRM